MARRKYSRNELVSGVSTRKNVMLLGRLRSRDARPSPSTLVGLSQGVLGHKLIFHSFIEVCPKTRSEIYRCGTPAPIPAIHHDWGKHRQNRTARRRPFSSDLHTMYRGPGPHALFWGPPYSTYTNAGHCLHVLLQGDNTALGSRPLRLLWLALPCRCLTLQILCVTSSLSSLYQLVILVPPACDYTSLLIIYVTRVILSSFKVLSSNLNVS